MVSPLLQWTTLFCMYVCMYACREAAFQDAIHDRVQALTLIV
jgi:hypothetical protein